MATMLAHHPSKPSMTYNKMLEVAVKPQPLVDEEPEEVIENAEAENVEPNQMTRLTSHKLTSQAKK